MSKAPLHDVQSAHHGLDSLVGIRVRHQNAALKADVILVHISRYHYIAMGESSFITFFLL